MEIALNAQVFLVRTDVSTWSPLIHEKSHSLSLCLSLISFSNIFSFQGVTRSPPWLHECLGILFFLCCYGLHMKWPPNAMHSRVRADGIVGGSGSSGGGEGRSVGWLLKTTPCPHSSLCLGLGFLATVMFCLLLVSNGASKSWTEASRAMSQDTPFLYAGLWVFCHSEKKLSNTGDCQWDPLPRPGAGDWTQHLRTEPRHHLQPYFVL